MNHHIIREIDPDYAALELENVHFDDGYLPVAIKKYYHHVIKIKDLKPPQANILKQSALSVGADAAVAKGCINCSIDTSDVLITATRKQLGQIIKNLYLQPFGLKNLATELDYFLKRRPQHLSLRRGQVLQWGDKTYVMGIVNVTPDSFYDGGTYIDIDKTLEHIKRMVHEGVDMIDIGAESTRPFAQSIDAEEELRRLHGVAQEIRKSFPQVILSIDTRKARVASTMLEIGFDMVNDVSGLTFDPEMIHVIATSGTPVIITHNKGTPETMQVDPFYHNLMDDITQFFVDKINQCLDHHIPQAHLILDPGIGFGKSKDHNWEILARIKELKSLGFPLMIGHSMKSLMEGMEREMSTVALSSMLVMQGVNIIRVHHVAGNKNAVKIAEQVRKISSKYRSFR